MYKEGGREERLVEENMVGEGEGFYQRVGTVSEEVYDRGTWRHNRETLATHKSGTKMKRKKK